MKILLIGLVVAAAVFSGVTSQELEEEEPEFNVDDLIKYPDLILQNNQTGNGSNSEIIDGYVAPRNYFDWQVSLRHNGGHICGGTLINRWWVLTAAHCIIARGSPQEVWLGAYYRNSLTSGVSSRHRVECRIIHTNYRVSRRYDIALLKLATPAVYSSSIYPVALVPAGVEIPHGTTTLISGWGVYRISGSTGYLPSQLRYAQVPVWTNSACTNASPFYFSSVELCVGNTNSFQSACYGDSGGPLIVKSRYGTRYVAGVASRVASGCRWPNFYTKVSALNSWIVRNMRNGCGGTNGGYPWYRSLPSTTTLL